jgi:hypothetical protein
MGVFVDGSLAEGFADAAREEKACDVEMLARLDHRRPAAIRAWIGSHEGTDGGTRDVAMALSRQGQVKYVAFLYRHSQQAKGTTVLSVLDADVTRVVPGDYAVDLVRRGSDGVLLRCLTARSVQVH